MNKNILVLSTNASDRLISKDGKLIRTQKGGPAYYIANTLRKKRVLFDLKLAPDMVVEIRITDKGEFGRVLKKPLPIVTSLGKVITPYLLVSSILDEIDISDLSNYRGKVFLDVQGFVRDGSNFGKKKNWNPTRTVANQIFCLKGTEEELTYLPSWLIKLQKSRILLVTKGEQGTSAYIARKQYIFTPKNPIKRFETVGAGDTFFANFISEYISTQSPLENIAAAINQTSEFLSSKPHHIQSL